MADGLTPALVCRPVIPTEECVSCNEKFAVEPSKGIRAPCKDFYCKECIVQLFDLSVKDDTLFPPRCHQQMIPLTTVKHFFTTGFQATFDRRLRERETQKRVYCPDGRCATFLGAEIPGRTRIPCPGCGIVVCLTCKKAHESYQACIIEDKEEEWLSKLMKDEKWQSCPKCHSLVELTVSNPIDSSNMTFNHSLK